MLMDDLGQVRHSPGSYLNLGGGNPGQVLSLHAWFSEELAALATRRAFDPLFASYDDPQGAIDFREILADFLRRHLGWPVSAANVLCTTGSQSSFFMLFNILAGRDGQGARRRILLPQSPEYIGYGELCFDSGALEAVASKVTLTGAHRFQYEIDFDALRAKGEVSALCLSRPTNPSGNICTDAEIVSLSALADDLDVPLIVDCAYGEPFPGITFRESNLAWSRNLVACFSLSKLGLPGMRAGIVVAGPELVRVLANMGAAMVLTTNPLGTRLAQALFESDRILDVVRNDIRPFYLDKARHALDCCEDAFAGLDYYVHEPGGAIFLWLWFRGLPISSLELYQRLKAKGVLVIPGQLFAPGLVAPTKQMSECIRISYAQSAEVVERGLRIIAEEVRAAFAQGPA